MIVALAILGIGLGVIFQGLGQGLRLRRDSAENVRFCVLAEQRLGELAALAKAPAEPREAEEEGWRWKVDPLADTAAASPADEQYPGPPLVKVRIAITSPTGREWEMTTLLPAP